MHRIPWRAAVVFGFLAFVGLAFAQKVSESELPLPVRTQVIELQKGWNAVWLEVEPLDAEPDHLFAGTPVDICARYFRPITSAQFIADPAEAPWNQEGWGVWYSPQRQDAVLKSLHRIQGGVSYLVHSTSAHQWSLPGKVRLHVYRWKHDAFNLVGFSVEAQSPPTFGQFFAGANGKVGSQVFRLVDGRWQRIKDLASTTMRSGEACWIFASGDSAFQGPLRVDLGGISAIDYGSTLDTIAVTHVNASPVPQQVTAELVAAGSSGGSAAGLPLSKVEVETATLTTAVSPVGGTVAEVASGFAHALRLQVGREAMNAASQTALLRLSNGAGFQVWVPVRAWK
ncbi:MAG: hypothetical protein V4710_18505 [Verrucomicrobiota bacterium]